MRNWNLMFCMWIWVLMLIASLPMRNWNGYYEKGRFCEFQIASLPMRNWNHLWGLKFYLAYTLRAYLWGIETSRRLWAEGIKTHCEPTYEELKQVSGISQDPRYLYDCEPTYEELKLVCGHVEVEGADLIASLPMRNWNFGRRRRAPIDPTHCEPTYEELKHLATAKSKELVTALRAYLWGIETK